MEDRNKTIHSEPLCQRKPFDGNYPHSFNDLFLRVYDQAYDILKNWMEHSQLSIASTSICMFVYSQNLDQEHEEYLV